MHFSSCLEQIVIFVGVTHQNIFKSPWQKMINYNVLWSFSINKFHLDQILPEYNCNSILNIITASKHLGSRIADKTKVQSSLLGFLYPLLRKKCSYWIRNMCVQLLLRHIPTFNNSISLIKD